MTRADKIRANVRKILAAATLRGPGWRHWSPATGTTNATRLAVGKSASCWPRGAFWFSEHVAKGDQTEERRRGVDIARWRDQAKAKARELAASCERVTA